LSQKLVAGSWDKGAVGWNSGKHVAVVHVKTLFSDDFTISNLSQHEGILRKEAKKAMLLRTVELTREKTSLRLCVMFFKCV